MIVRMGAEEGAEAMRSSDILSGLVKMRGLGSYGGCRVEVYMEYRVAN